MRALILAWVMASCLLLSVKVSAESTESIMVGDTFTLQSEALSETRRINVFTPTRFGEPVETPLPVLYLLDGGIDEDFLHIAGLVQVLVSNGSMQPHLLVGIENTERARDMTGPSEDEEDLAMAPAVGGAHAFRTFIGETLIPEIERRYDVSSRRALIGESLAGLFVVETLVQAPTMFETYIAADPSVWWNQYALSASIATALQGEAYDGRRVFIAFSREAGNAERFQQFMAELGRVDSPAQVIDEPMPEQSHATLFHPAAFEALSTLFPAATTD